MNKRRIATALCLLALSTGALALGRQAHLSGGTFLFGDGTGNEKSSLANKIEPSSQQGRKVQKVNLEFIELVRPMSRGHMSRQATLCLSISATDAFALSTHAKLS
jgi:hypothetical protein